ncbi:MAG: hypothetical protein XD95_0071 [Microgenomates bacterium 39_7]|nr:MAG: hypothetical protein XD95_0071 [Microgenomates bacterium 39_7]
MTEIKMLVGSLSNDLFRVASLAQRGSTKAAIRFLKEAKRWSKDLQEKPTATYINKIAKDISSRDKDDISEESAEQYLMYGILLQNYSLHSS